MFYNIQRAYHQWRFLVANDVHDIYEITFVSNDLHGYERTITVDMRDKSTRQRRGEVGGGGGGGEGKYACKQRQIYLKQCR